MLSTKYVKVHGMKNEKWNTREKMIQYRTILKLHVRDKKLQTINATKLKLQVSKNLKELSTDVIKYRQIVNDVISGDKRLFRTVWQNQKDFQTVLHDTEPSEAFTAIFQDYNLKRKQLDKLLHVKEKKTQEFCNLKSEYTMLLQDINEGKTLAAMENKHKYQQRQQQLISRFQVALSQRNAAKSIHTTYHEIRDILRKDSMYFDAVLNALRNDQKDQSNVIYKTTIMAQLATENLDDIRIKYKKMARDVWVNMKEREKTLEFMRRKVDDVWQYAKSLVRIDSDANLLKKKKKKTIDVDKKLQKQIQQLENIFNIMKDSMLIQSYEELFIRLDDQIKQRTRLSRLYERTLKQRDSEMKNENHAGLLLKTLEHSVISTTARYKTDKKAMLDKIEKEKDRINKNNSLIDTNGKQLMNIRVALQNIASMIMCAKVTKPPVKSKCLKEVKEVDESEVKDEEENENKNECEEPVENEGLAVLHQVIRKAIILVGQTNFPLNKDKQEKARNFYENYIATYRSQLAFEDQDKKQGIFFEHEIVDTSVLTRRDIKMRSKQIVEANIKLD
ncbi:PREDICTED: uncharacterized protein LOC105360091 [Ceratosolen solmsi marchali]|uniref:Uncharacterized protein LOC105360091 n=1 Tax=Ceratosolen solmsi marchali TaxID=326594 RepID=A0AAJ6VLF0_9HYME|nr:PREDICTED: uncharacterized protein LOC105360091 [Ceratosolen solmsi marchali]